MNQRTQNRIVEPYLGRVVAMLALPLMSTSKTIGWVSIWVFLPRRVCDRVAKACHNDRLIV